MKNYNNELKEKYNNIFELDRNIPNWGVRKKSIDENIHPATPFVGKTYERTKLLLYASAENLTYYEKNSNDKRFDDDNAAIIRRQLRSGNYFPDIYISPVSDGSLLIVVAYILDKLNIKLNYSTPFEFIENIAIDNFCKFSIKSQNKSKNKDYAADKEKLKFSYDYVRSDLEILKPNILILPKKIYDHIEVREIIKLTLPNCLVLPLYQINAGNINRIIAKKYKKKEKNDIQETQRKWQSQLSNGIKGKTNENFYSVYTYLDEILEREKALFLK